MGYIHLLIESPVELTVQQNRLNILTGDETLSYPIEDMDAIVIDNRRVRWTVAVPTTLAQAGCAVYVCDEKHLPCCVLQPFAQYYKQLATARLQFALTEPRKKRLWQQIVRQKLKNQGACLRICGNTWAADKLDIMAEQVLSGDSGHMEAAGAAYYFPQMFGPGFTRGDEEDGRNAALNYGYAILRGYIARTLASYGFLPQLGLNHKSELNAFNLADDLIEPFRPVVDCYVESAVLPDEEMSRVHKTALLDLLSAEVTVNGKHYGVAYAIELLVQSLLNCMETKEAELTLPIFTELTRHQYE